MSKYASKNMCSNKSRSKIDWKIGSHTLIGLIFAENSLYFHESGQKNLKRLAKSNYIKIKNCKKICIVLNLAMNSM